MTIEQWWNLLDAHTRRWLVENPGSMVLPRTVVNAVNATTGGLLHPGPHGEFSLSAGDREFIRHLAADGGGSALVARAGSACAAAEGLARFAAGLEVASVADPGPAALRSVLEDLLAAERSVKASLRHLAAAGAASQPSADDPAPDRTAVDLEEAAMEAEVLLKKLAHALGGLPPVSQTAPREGARAS